MRIHVILSAVASVLLIAAMALAQTTTTLPPNTVAWDTFTGSDGTLLFSHPSNSGHMWTVAVDLQNVKLDGDTLRKISGTAKQINLLNVPDLGPDYRVTVDVAETATTDNTPCVAARAVALGATKTGYVVMLSGAGALTLWMRPVTATASVKLGEVAVGDWSMGNLGIEVSGNQIKALWNGEVRITATDTVFADAGNPGIGCGWRDLAKDNNVRYDNFVVTRVPGAFPLSCVMYWKFNEGTGETVHDLSGWGNHGTGEGGPLVWASGTSAVEGSALAVSPSFTWVRVSPSPSLNSMTQVTLSTWLRPPFDQTNMVLLNKGGYTQYSLEFRQEGLIWWFVGGQLLEYALPRCAEWVHLTATYDGQQSCLYMNGELVAQRPLVGAVISGGTAMGNGQGDAGIMDEVRIYNVAMTPAEVAALFHEYDDCDVRLFNLDFLDALEVALAAHPTRQSLGAALADIGYRSDFLGWVEELTSFASSTAQIPGMSETRQGAYNRVKGWIETYPDILGGDTPAFSQYFLGYNRAAFWTALVWLPSPLESYKDDIADTLNLQGAKLDVWNSNSIILLDNNRLSAQGLAVFKASVTQLPQYYLLRTISQRDYLLAPGEPTDGVGFSIHAPSCNIYSYWVGSENICSRAGNPVWLTSSFATCVVHEMYHQMDDEGNLDAMDPGRTARVRELYDRHGGDTNQTLRTGHEASFTEFIPGNSQAYYAHTWRALKYAMQRCDNGYKEPLNVLLWFARDSCVDGKVRFYMTDSAGNVTVRRYSVQRNAAGYITYINFDDVVPEPYAADFQQREIIFTLTDSTDPLDKNNVVSYAISAPPTTTLATTTTIPAMTTTTTIAPPTTTTEPPTTTTTEMATTTTTEATTTTTIAAPTTTTLPTQSIAGTGITMYTLPDQTMAHDTLTLNVSALNGTIASRKLSIVTLNPRRAIVSTSVTTLACGAVQQGAPAGAVLEGRVQGIAMLGALDRDYQYMVKVWDMPAPGKDWVSYVVWKGLVNVVNAEPRALTTGLFTLTPAD